jgi:hypothetical protein
MEYKISQVEIKRRKKAYLTLSLSLIVGLVLSSLIFNYPITLLVYFVYLVTILLLGCFSFNFFHKLLQTKILLSNSLLTRISNKVPEEYPLCDIRRVKIKWTTNNTIREIYIWLKNSNSVYITALDKFEDFKKELITKLTKNNITIPIEEIHEPMDFDHPLFYSILGLPISALGVYFFKIASSIDYNYLKIGSITFAVYLVALGLYFIASKPISKRSGNKTIASDYIMGIFMILSSVFILIYTLPF